jgi:alkylation response protein AidB-like acyl-CoA dehydrogenase
LSTRITSPENPAFDELASGLVTLAPSLDRPNAWPSDQLKLCGEFGVFEWFAPLELGGQGWNEINLLRGYVKLAAACLTTTFVITQRSGAMQRIAAGESDLARNNVLSNLISGHSFATVGISHLTTSRQHLARPVLEATERDGGFVLNGYSPWVTGAEFAQHVVVGATLPDGRQILVCLPTDRPGVTAGPAVELVGLAASRTGPLRCDQVFVESPWLLAGPIHEVMKQGLGARTGGSQTSALAIGLASGAIDYLKQQSIQRGDLADPADSLIAERDALVEAMLQLADGVSTTERPLTSNDLRVRANSLALRASQAALAAAKGAGYVVGHPAGRWCREALFFLVWSCPAPVLQANLCELACIQE